MLASQHTQSLTDFRQNATQTLVRLSETGEAEILTVNGQARAVILSPEAFDTLTRDAELTRDVATIRRAMEQIDGGLEQDADAFFGGLRKKLQAMKKAQRSQGR